VYVVPVMIFAVREYARFFNSNIENTAYHCRMPQAFAAGMPVVSEDQLILTLSYRHDRRCLQDAMFVNRLCHRVKILFVVPPVAETALTDAVQRYFQHFWDTGGHSAWRPDDQVSTAFSAYVLICHIDLLQTISAEHALSANDN
jgi:hypothetical protein